MLRRNVAARDAKARASTAYPGEKIRRKPSESLAFAAPIG